MRAISICLLIGLSSAATARPVTEEERTELARQHFQAAEALFRDSHFRDAVVEYELAQTALPLPSIELQVARCYEGLGARAQALAAYRRYLATRPGAENEAPVRARIAALELPPPPPSAPAPPLAAPSPPLSGDRRAPRYLAPILVANLALIALAAGGALLGTVRADVDRLERSCAPRCAPSLVGDLPAREQAGWALLGIGAAAVVADVALWIVAARRHRPARRASFSPARLTVSF